MTHPKTNQPNNAETSKEQSFSEEARALLKLSRREGKVLLLVAEGYTSKEIAQQLYLSIRTIETHRYCICQELDLSGQQALEGWVKEINL
jgi:DNA-binding NarL/FixJ family response regulator